VVAPSPAASVNRCFVFAQDWWDGSPVLRENETGSAFDSDLPGVQPESHRSRSDTPSPLW
jgi:hypothetical protein